MAIVKTGYGLLLIQAGSTFGADPVGWDSSDNAQNLGHLGECDYSDLKREYLPNEAMTSGTYRCPGRAGRKTGSISTKQYFPFIYDDYATTYVDEMAAGDLSGVHLPVMAALGSAVIGGYRAAGVVTASSSTTTIDVTDAASFEVGQAVLVQCGAAGVDGWDVGWVKSIAGSVLTLRSALVGVPTDGTTAYGSLTSFMAGDGSLFDNDGYSIMFSSDTVKHTITAISCEPTQYVLTLEPGKRITADTTWIAATYLDDLTSGAGGTAGYTAVDVADRLCVAAPQLVAPPARCTLTHGGATTAHAVRKATLTIDNTIEPKIDMSVEDVVAAWTKTTAAAKLELELYYDSAQTVIEQVVNVLYGAKVTAGAVNKGDQTACNVVVTAVAQPGQGISICMPGGLLTTEPRISSANGVGIMTVTFEQGVYAGDTDAGGTHEATDALVSVAQV